MAVGATTIASTTTVAPAAIAPLVVLWSGGSMALHDPVSGALLGIVGTYEPEGVTVIELTRAADGAIYYGLALEDSWYSCDASQGAIESLGVDGEFSSVANGAGPAVSADGTNLAYVRSSGCQPDPDEPTYVVVSTDTVTVRSVATGEELDWTFPGAEYEPGAPSVVGSAVWSGSRVMTIVDDRLVTIDPSDPSVPDIGGGVPIQLSSGDPRGVDLVRTRSDGALLAAVHDENNNSRLVVIDPTTGIESAELAPIGTWSDLSADPTGAHWAGLRDGRVVVDGRAVELQRPDPTIDDRPAAIGW